MAPKGKLLIIGGAEDKGEGNESPEIKARNKEFKHFEILGELFPPENRKHHTIEVITTASETPVEVGRRYLHTFMRAGFTNVHTMCIHNLEEARQPEYAERITNAHAVLFTGGDQFRLSTILGGTPLIEAICKKYQRDENFIVAGTSAGAMVMSRLMIIAGQTNEAMLKGDLQLSSGFGLIDNCIIDTHFVRRGRFGRLAQAVVMNPTFTGIGLGEDTALIIRKGNEAECRGSGMVILIEGKDIGVTNIAYVEEGRPIYVSNLRVHVMAKGNGFRLKERDFIDGREKEKPQPEKEKEKA